MKQVEIAKVVCYSPNTTWGVTVCGEPLYDDFGSEELARKTAARINHHIAEAYAKEGNQ